MKHCNFCSKDLDVEAFCSHPRTKDGLSNKCRECQKEYRQKHYAKTRAKQLQQMAEYRGTGKKAESDARQRVGGGRTYGDQQHVDFIYHTARALQAVYGGRVPEVDHIVPITHDQVCGLHTPCNLQLLSRPDNRQKANRWEMD